MDLIILRGNVSIGECREMVSGAGYSTSFGPGYSMGLDKF